MDRLTKLPSYSSSKLLNVSNLFLVSTAPDEKIKLKTSLTAQLFLKLNVTPEKICEIAQKYIQVLSLSLFVSHTHTHTCTHTHIYTLGGYTDQAHEQSCQFWKYKLKLCLIKSN